MNNLPSLLLVSLVAALWPEPAISQERRDILPQMTLGVPASENDPNAIDQLIFAYKTAWSAQNTAVLMSLHSPDTEWINAYARIFRGRELLGEFLDDRLFPQFDPNVSVREIDNMKTISRRYVGDGGAVIHMYTDGDRGVSRKDTEDLRRTHIHLVLERQAGTWLIVHTAIMDAR
ncbi:nuclear transport factor 2 family protein [uncultured Roseibium sp.]|uniref:YybH family protein n=1 Tax=uncultured Roseibium sp. TaxID=1936171 RepID=UPI00261A901A|nr:nuclear transport factor 2 family protein [uncultured Roseibium sp.]